MEDELFEDFTALDWCRDLLNSPDVIDTTTGTRRPPPPAADLLTCRLVSETLKTPTAMRAWRTLVAKRTAPPNAGPECYLLLSLGQGLDSYRDVMHGGMLSLLVDQLAGVVASRAALPRARTAELKVSYKKSVVLPAVVLCRAAPTKLEGGKVWVEATVEDGKGLVYCQATVLLIHKGAKPKPSL